MDTTSQSSEAPEPFRIAIIGAGPSGFYTAEHLLKTATVPIQIDLFDMLPTPYGLVRAGVAPDHEKIKNVTARYDVVADRPEFRFFGNVELGRHLSVDDLRSCYHQIVYTTGAQVDRELGIPGEDLPGSHSATEFVAWYNGHPDFRDREFDLSQSAAAVVGVGNVAIDVARILARPVADLEKTDMADYAIDALRNSGVRTVYVLGRRGPAQAAFTNPEAKELGELEDVNVLVEPDEVELDDLTKEELEASPDRLTEKKVKTIQTWSTEGNRGGSKTIHFRFLVSPTEIIEKDGRVGAIRIVKNVLAKDSKGRVRPKATEETEVLPVGLVFRSVGYRGTAIPGVPFNDSWGVIPQADGRVTTEEGTVVLGEYTAGWIKRGPSGVIGTNKADAQATVDAMLADMAEGRLLKPSRGSSAGISDLLSEKGVRWVSWEDWKRLNDLECAAGGKLGRPRVKFTTREEMLEKLD